MNELSLHVLDILQNSIKAGATLITLEFALDTKAETLTITITDNGTGMSEELVRKVLDPFVTSRTTRRVGMGLSLFRQSAEGTGGSLSIKSQLGKGTTVTAVFYYGHIDCPPLGNMTDTFLAQVLSSPEIDFIYRFTTAQGEMSFDTREVRAVLGEVPLSQPEVYTWMQESINEEIKEIGGGNLI